jgi:hypothetical protein
MKYRDDLEAAQQRIHELENRVQELEEKKKPPEVPAATRAKGKAPPAVGCAFGGMGLVAFIVGLTVFGAHGCLACNSDVTDPALEALKRCPAAREMLGDDIGWSFVGCHTYKSGTGGDPFNGGCSSSQSYRVPVSGSKGRGSYVFSASQPAGKDNAFQSGVLFMNGKTVMVPADGPCR